MSIYNYELTRLNGDIKVFVRIQNDWSGAILEGIRNVFNRDGKYYFRADGQAIDITKQREEWLAHEDYLRTAVNWYEKTKF